MHPSLGGGFFKCWGRTEAVANGGLSNGLVGADLWPEAGSEYNAGIVHGPWQSATSIHFLFFPGISYIAEARTNYAGTSFPGERTTTTRATLETAFSKMLLGIGPFNEHLKAAVGIVRPVVVCNVTQLETPLLSAHSLGAVMTLLNWRTVNGSALAVYCNVTLPFVPILVESAELGGKIRFSVGNGSNER
eukprot:COSAG05_NODE_9448_length_623_cov_0.688931_1_plen_189_part_01